VLSFRERIHFLGVSFMHEAMYGLFMKAEDLLLPAGVEKGQKILEVGCGPGFYTIPAAKIVGEEGIVYANDINPFAIKRVKKKISKKKIKNVKLLLENVTETSLLDDSIDLVFFFGVLHSLVKIIDDVMLEMDRILTKDGIIAIQKTGKSAEGITELIEKTNRFKLIENTKRIMKFSKRK